MSYNVAICTEPVPSRDEEAWQAVDSFIDAKGEPPEVFKELHDRLTKQYPCICTLSDDRAMMMAFGATGRCGITSAIAQLYWEWSIHEWKRFFRFSWKQLTTSDWLCLTGQDRVFTVRKTESCESAVLAATCPITRLNRALAVKWGLFFACSPRIS
jgi:hypothetical protein